MRLIYRCFVIAVASSIALVIININAVAMHTNFSTKSLTESDVNTFLSNINLSLISDVPDNSRFECFDVNSDHDIALGHKFGQRKAVCIYSNDGVFKYGYVFNCSGSFGVEWDEDNINIYFTRSDVIISVNFKGEILDILELEDTEQNRKYRNHILHSDKRVVGETEYLAKNDAGVLNIFSSSYSQLYATTRNNNTIIYEANKIETISNLIWCVIGIIIFLFALVLATRKIIKIKQNAGGDGSVH